MAYRAARFPGARRVLAQDAVDRYDLRRTLLARLLSEQPTLSLLVMVGDVEMDDLDLDARGGDRPAAAFARQEPDVHGLVIAGDLLVHGDVHHPRLPAGMSLYVLGDLRARNVAVSGLELVVSGDVRVADVLCGTGPAGGARLDGTVRARLLISDGFPMLIGQGLEAPVLDNGRTRIGVVEHGNVQERFGDAEPSLVLAPDLLGGPEVPGGELLRARISSGLPVLSPQYRDGQVDLTAVRELAWLEEQITATLAEGRHLIAIDLLRAARQRGADPFRTGLQLADALYRVHQPTGDREGLAEALELLDTLLGAAPSPDIVAAHPEALVQRAAIRLQLHEHDDGAFELAFRDCTQASVMLPPRFRPGIASLLGQWLFGRRRYADCVPYLEQALEGAPDDGLVHGSLARALWMLDREAAAVPHATRSLQLNPGDERMWFVRGKCHQVLGDIDAARADLQAYLERHPDDALTVEALVELGLDAGEEEQALRRAEAFVSSHPEIEDAPVRLGRLFHVRQLYSGAVPFLQRAVEVDPDHRSTVIDLGVALTEAPPVGWDARGLETALRLAELDTDGSHLAYLRGECFLALGDAGRAASALLDYVARFPEEGRPMASLAMAQARLGRTDEALRTLTAARALGDDDYVTAVTTRVRQGNVAVGPATTARVRSAYGTPGFDSPPTEPLPR